jgi:hypothetical protein
VQQLQEWGDSFCVQGCILPCRPPTLSLLTSHSKAASFLLLLSYLHSPKGMPCPVHTCFLSFPLSCTLSLSPAWSQSPCPLP